MTSEHSPKFTQKSNRGFTLIELLIYLAIVSVVVNSLVIFGLNVISLGSKSKQQEEVYSATSILSEKIKYEIRNSDDINTGVSDFGINLADNPGKKISLKETGANNPMLFDVSAGNARITRGGSVPTVLNSTGTKVTDLTFTNLSSGDGLTKHLKFILTITALNPSSGNIYESATIESSAEQRSH